MPNKELDLAATAKPITFKDLALAPNVAKALESLGFEKPTEIQSKAIPLLTNKKTDFHGQAQTGTGKTLAFGIPLTAYH